MSSHDPLKLNVGGRVFCTTRHTLLDSPRSAPDGGGYLGRLLGGGGTGGGSESGSQGRFAAAATVDGAVFIDRDPRGFELVLAFLRGYDVEYPENDAQLAGQLESDALFYGIPGLIAWLKERRERERWQTLLARIPKGLRSAVSSEADLQALVKECEFRLHQMERTEKLTPAEIETLDTGRPWQHEGGASNRLDAAEEAVEYLCWNERIYVAVRDRVACESRAKQYGSSARVLFYCLIQAVKSYGLLHDADLAAFRNAIETAIREGVDKCAAFLSQRANDEGAEAKRDKTSSSEAAIVWSAFLPSLVPVFSNLVCAWVRRNVVRPGEVSESDAELEPPQQTAADIV